MMFSQIPKLDPTPLPQDWNWDSRGLFSDIGSTPHKSRAQKEIMRNPIVLKMVGRLYSRISRTRARRGRDAGVASFSAPKQIHSI